MPPTAAPRTPREVNQSADDVRVVTSAAAELHRIVVSRQVECAALRTELAALRQSDRRTRERLAGIEKLVCSTKGVEG